MKDLSQEVQVRRVTPKDEVCFFGYYDVSPENASGTRVLFNRAPFGDRMPSKSDALTLSFYSFETKESRTIGETTAWNFQEGCRLQWVSDRACIYNVRTDAGYGSVVYDTEAEKELRRYDFPVYSVCGRRCVFFNFNRSRYSYAHEVSQEETDYARDGIFLGDLETGKSELLLSLEKLSRDAGSEQFKNWVEHCVLNPSGDLFCFFHRWSDEKSGMHTRFCVSDLNGEYKVLLDQGFCSHFGWKNDRIISAWGRLPSKINSVQSNPLLIRTGIYKVLVSLYHRTVKNASMRQKISNDAYIFFDVQSLRKWKLDNPDFVVDGHGTWSKNEDYMITDTYPDSGNFRHLLLYHAPDNQVFELGRFFSYPDIRDTERYSIAGIRCDLHPKWGENNRHVYFDSTHEGYRALYMIDLSRMLPDAAHL